MKCLKRIDSERYASGSADSTIKIWNSTNGNLIRTLTGHNLSVNCLEVLSPNRLVSGGADGTIRFWDLTTYNLSHTIFSAHTGQAVLSLKRLNDKRLASGSAGNKDVPNIKVFSLNCLLQQNLNSFF